MDQLVDDLESRGASQQAALALFGRKNAAVVEGRRVRLPRMALILSAFLLIDCPQMRASREQAGRFLWEDLPHDRQSGNLRQLLMRVRILQAANRLRLFKIYEDHIALEENAADIDLCIFRAAAKGNSIQDLESICAAYPGDLLADVNVDGERLSQWLTSRRALLRSEFVSAVLPFLEEGQGDIRSDAAVAAAKRLIEIEPFHEAGYRALMRAYQSRGDYAAARRLYGRLERLLAKELGCKPSPATRDFFQLLSARETHSSSRPAPKAASGVEEIGDRRAPPSSFVRVGAPRIGVFASLRTSDPIAHEVLDGFANDLATRLSQFRTFVVSLPEAPPGLQTPLESRLDYLVDIRARRGTDAPSLYLRLIEVSTREILYASDFAAPDTFGDSLLSVARRLVENIENCELRFLAMEPEAKSAYRLAVQGQRFLQTIDLPSIRRARAHFKAANSVIADYSPALAGIARSYVWEWVLRMNSDRGLLEAAEQCARKIILNSSDDYRGFRELGFVQMYSRKIEEAIQNYNISLRLNPLDLDAQVDLADAMTLAGQAENAISAFAESDLLRQRGSDYDHWILAGAHFLTQNYRGALEEIARMHNRMPALKLSAASYTMLGEGGQARQTRAELMEFNPDFNVTQWIAIVPCNDAHYLKLYSEGLRMAGFR